MWGERASTGGEALLAALERGESEGRVVREPGATIATSSPALESSRDGVEQEEGNRAENQGAFYSSAQGRGLKKEPAAAEES